MMDVIVIAAAAIAGPWLAWHKRDAWRGSPVLLALATIYPAKAVLLVVKVMA